MLIFAGLKCKVRGATIWGQRVYDDGAGENCRTYALVHQLCLFNFANGNKVIYRGAPGFRIPGGSEDVLLDLAIRQFVKAFQTRDELLGQPRRHSKL